MRCVNCKKTGTYRPWKGPVELMGVRIEGQGMRCESCGELLFDADEVRRQERALASALVQRGIRIGREFKLVRKLAGLRAAELAEMLDVRPETVSRWERDEVAIPRSAAFVLGELFDRPREARRRLAALAVEAVPGQR